jgi:predicted  nucleic acid-binding Zn-ribbon protein
MTTPRVFLFSIKSDGLVSLWDYSAQRQRGAEKDEAFVDMPLTSAQEWRLLNAQPKCDKCMTHKREIAQLLIEVRNLRDEAQDGLTEVERLNRTLDRLQPEVDRLRGDNAHLKLEHKECIGNMAERIAGLKECIKGLRSFERRYVSETAVKWGL